MDSAGPEEVLIPLALEQRNHFRQTKGTDSPVHPSQFAAKGKIIRCQNEMTLQLFMVGIKIFFISHFSQRHDFY